MRRIHSSFCVGFVPAFLLAFAVGNSALGQDASPAADAKPDRSAVRKRAAQRARERRRSAARRARLAVRQAAVAAQQAQANPFGQTQTTVARTAQ